LRRLVVDTSVVAKWFIAEGEPHRDLSLQILREALEERSELHAPTLLVFELGNVIVARARARREAPRRAALEDLFDIPLRWHSPDPALCVRALRVAARRALTFYDASFVALADFLDAPLITADDTLARRVPGGRVRPLASR
jgi:predicted nucleic acid-binding protein